MSRDIIVLVALLLLLTVLVVTGPLAVIWSLNTLFGLEIPYTIWTWVATWVLHLAVTSAVYRNKKNS